MKRDRSDSTEPMSPEDGVAFFKTRPDRQKVIVEWLDEFVDPPGSRPLENRGMTEFVQHAAEDRVFANCCFRAISHLRGRISEPGD